ncbi:hypothetical protein [Azohydromonas australica]|uniref:hypothetical protein n=1 Tax=Azohydromonas australica TaxID=364039 RepID=UPI00041D9C46|nr:hypothetical protein [Azohydromonas australica]
MSQLGPITGNRITDACRTSLKPHLRERLALQSCRSTPLGTVATGADGRLSFAPNYLLHRQDRSKGAPDPMPRSAFRPGQRVRVDATADDLLEQDLNPFEPEEAAALAGREGEVVEHSGCASLGLVLVMLDGVPWAFMPAYLVPACPAEGGDEMAATTGEVAAAFDPYCEPLAVGDTVQAMDGRIGRVTVVAPQRLDVVFEHGSPWCGGDTNCRGSLRLLARAGAWGHPTGCPF